MRALLLLAVLALAGCIQVEVGGGDPAAGDEEATGPTSAGRTASRTFTATGAAGQPRLSFTTDPAAPSAGQVVLFELQATGLARGDQVASARWDFGDGGQSTERHPPHTFAANGTYVVTVSATTAQGAKPSHQALLRVGNATGVAPPASGNGTADNETGSQPFEPEDPNGSCGAFDSFTPVAPDPLLAGGLATGWPLLELDIAAIADPSFVAAHPDDWQDLLRDLVLDANAYYEPQLGLRLNASLIDRLPDGSLQAGRDDGMQRAVARGYMHANHPGADVDAVAVILGSDYEGSTAGMVECVHGAGYPDYSYLWAEYDEERVDDPPAIGVLEDLPLKIFMHELAHLLAAHHHYSTCGHPYAEARTSDLAGACDVMINDIGLASFYFSGTNRLVIRSYVEEIGIGEPV